MLSLLIIFAVGMVLTLLTHEASHAAAAKLVGRQVLEFKPWPHFHGGKFYFGRVVTDGPTERMDVVHAAPVKKSGLVLILLMLTTAGFGVAGVDVTKYTMTLAGCELIDTLWWLKGYYLGGPHTDGAKWRVLKHG